MRRRPEHADVYVQLGVAVRALELVTEALVTQPQREPGELTGAARELQAALARLHDGYADLWTAFNSAGASSAASVLALVLTRQEELMSRVRRIERHLGIADDEVTP